MLWVISWKVIELFLALKGWYNNTTVSLKGEVPCVASSVNMHAYKLYRLLTSTIYFKAIFVFQWSLLNLSPSFNVICDKNDIGWTFNHHVGRHGPINHMIGTGSYDFYDLTLWVGVYHYLSTRQSNSFQSLILYYKILLVKR